MNEPSFIKPLTSTEGTPRSFSKSVLSASSAVKTFNWKSATPAERNAACAQFLPASETNPIRSFHLHHGREDHGQLNVTSLAKAEAWLDAVRATKENWQKYIPQIPWALASGVTIWEATRHVRYTDTPAGAWMLLEHLTTEGYRVTVQAQHGFAQVSAGKVRFDGSPDPLSAPRGFMGGEPFNELAAMLFLTLNGIEVKS